MPDEITVPMEEDEVMTTPITNKMASAHRGRLQWEADGFSFLWPNPQWEEHFEAHFLKWFENHPPHRFHKHDVDVV